MKIRLGAKIKPGERIKGIVGAARTLDVNRFHLSEVVRGRRSSPRLLARYVALKEGQH